MRPRFDPTDERVKTLTPKQFEKEHGVDLRNYGYTTFRDSEGVTYSVYLDFVKTTYGTRTYWKCPRCHTRCHKLMTVGSSGRYACRHCLQELGIIAYHCQALKGNPAWESFGRHFHKAAKARRQLVERRPRGDKKEQILLTLLAAQNTALAKQREYYVKMLAHFAEKQAVLDAEYEKWLESRGVTGLSSLP